MRKIVSLLLGSSIVALCVGYVLTNSTIFKICTHEEYDCRDLYNSIGDPLYYGAIPLVIVFFVLLIFPYAFKVWQKFALWFLPFAIGVFSTYTGPGRGYVDVTPDSVTIFKWLGGIYIVISLSIVIFCIYKKKYGKEATPKIPSKKQKVIFWSLWILYVLVIIGIHFFN